MKNDGHLGACPRAELRLALISVCVASTCSTGVSPFISCCIQNRPRAQLQLRNQVQLSGVAANMNLGLRLSLYIFIIACCTAALVGGFRWLTLTDPALALTAGEKAPRPIPPRIQESIERKAPFPVQEPEKVRAVASLPPLPELRTAPVSLFVPKLIDPPKARAIRVARASRKKHELPTTETYVVPVTRTVAMDRTETGF